MIAALVSLGFLAGFSAGLLAARLIPQNLDITIGIAKVEPDDPDEAWKNEGPK